MVYKADILVPAGTPIQFGIAGSNKFGKGGGLQVYIEKTSDLIVKNVNQW